VLPAVVVLVVQVVLDSIVDTVAALAIATTRCELSLALFGAAQLIDHCTAISNQVGLDFVGIQRVATCHGQLVPSQFVQVVRVALVVFLDLIVAAAVVLRRTVGVRMIAVIFVSVVVVVVQL